ncbi:hypothetical protein GBA52_003825 [Prunus armeniaca]|nr:hypothetical protein GBA52_003825 [Prunus armeniaca]
MKRRRCVGAERLLQFEPLGQIRILGGDFPCVQQRYVRLRRVLRAVNSGHGLIRPCVNGRRQ